MTYLTLSEKQVVEAAMEPQSSESQLHFSCLAYLTFFFTFLPSTKWYIILWKSSSLRFVAYELFFFLSQQKSIFIKRF